MEQEPEIKGLDLDEVLQDLDAIRDVVNSLQPSPLTLADLEAILRQPELLPPGCSARPTGTYGFAWTQPGLDKEMRVICNASYYKDNSDSCELWVPGSPLFPKGMAEASLNSISNLGCRKVFLKALETDEKRRVQG